MDRKKQILELAKSRGIIRPRDVEVFGIQREYLIRMRDSGELERIGRGLYAIPGTLTSEFSSLAEVSSRIPDGVICLLSALSFHGLTTQLPHKVWVAIKYGSWGPDIKSPQIELVRMKGKAFTYAIEEHEVNRVQVKVFNPAKTIADCFKFRGRIGLDIPIEALREAWRDRIVTMDELSDAAKVCRMTNVMKPYMEMLT